MREKVDEEGLKEAMREVTEAYQRHQKHIQEIVDNLDLSEVDKKEVITILYDVLMQSCGAPEGDPSNVDVDLSEQENDTWADSRALSAYRDGLKLLEKLGLFKTHREAGRRVIGKFKGW